jgi:metal-responsive CopG/Arc/MetJ family transcriptional regulator
LFRLLYASDMRTIAITIDEKTLKRIDRLKAEANAPFKSRSEVIRQAAQEFVSRFERLTEEDRERAIFRRNRKRLSRQSLELIKEQAKP